MWLFVTVGWWCESTWEVGGMGLDAGSDEPPHPSWRKEHILPTVTSLGYVRARLCVHPWSMVWCSCAGSWETCNVWHGDVVYGVSNSWSRVKSEALSWATSDEIQSPSQYVVQTITRSWPPPTFLFVSLHSSSHLLPVFTPQIWFCFIPCLCRWWNDKERKGSFSPPFWFLPASCISLIQAMGAKTNVSDSWKIIWAWLYEISLHQVS